MFLSIDILFLSIDVWYSVPDKQRNQICRQRNVQKYDAFALAGRVDRTHKTRALPWAMSCCAFSPQCSQNEIRLSKIIVRLVAFHSI